MNDRIHAALDGELGREQLTPAEAAAADAAVARFEAVMATIPQDTLPDLSAAVLGRIEAAAGASAGAEAADISSAETTVAASPGRSTWQARVRELIRRFWEPRRISFDWRPAYGLGLALAIGAMLVLGRSAPPAQTTTQKVFTRFVLNAPDARDVAVAGDFTNWEPSYSLTRSEPGVWTVVVPLEPGIHEYAFVVDGERWVPDPNAPAVDDGFGGLNSRLAVLAPDGGES